MKKLTKKFIKENAGMTLKEAFPEVFEKQIQLGWNKMYFDTDLKQEEVQLFVFVTKIQREEVWFKYGLKNDKWEEKDWAHSDHIWIPATPQEIQDALEKEAVRRGFKECVMFKSAVSNYEAICNGKFSYNQKLNELYSNYTCIFSNGKFSTIIPTITKQEAEERLGMKII